MNRVKLGHIKYINSYPIFYTILKERESLPFDLISDVPTRLNNMMREGMLDVSLISSFEYVAAPGKYLIYKDFCLASTGYVNSVLLISKKDIEELNGANIGVSSSSATCANLIKIILKEFYGFSNEFYQISYRKGFDIFLKNSDAILLIGDEALKFIDHDKYKVYDLSHLWNEKTGYPVVFAIIAINIESAKIHESTLELIFKKFRESYEIFKNHPEEIAEFSRRNSKLAINFTKYFSNIEYTFSAELKEGLIHYYRMLEKCGLIEKAEKLRFY